MIKRRKNRVGPPPHECPLMECLNIIGGAWTPNIIWYLSGEPRRFSELKDDLDGISAKVLTQRLKMLVEKGMLSRTVMPTSPPTVEYELTVNGRDLLPAIEALVQAGQRIKARARCE